MKEKYYITTPIYYASGDLTVGHCFCTVLTDACARFARLDGKDVMFLTGSDEHGLKIARNAEKAGLSPQAFVDKTVDKFKYVWNRLGVSYDKFIRTTDPIHEKCVKDAYQKLYDQGDIYLAKYEGLYCVPCETFFTESQLVDGNCPDCGRPVEMATEESYFFKLSKYQKYLEDLFAKNPDFLVPESRKNEIYNNFIKPGVTDLCVSRTTFDWGVRLPFNDKHVAYVWIDALLNYVTALGWNTEDDSLLKKYWPAEVHFVGRDITRFHCIIWPILLHALGLEVPKQIHSTGFITLKGDKISKSKSNGFNPITLCDKYGADALRYYLVKEGPIYSDIPYTSEIFLNTINSDLCNNYGNLVSRTLAMITQYFGGVVPAPTTLGADEDTVINALNTLYEDVKKDMSTQRCDMAIKKIFNVIDLANKYIDITTPWKLAKEEGGKDKLQTVMYTLTETIRICTTLLQAFLVEMPAKVFEQFNTKAENRTFDSAKAFSKDNHGQNITKGDAIFNRLDVKKEMEFLDTASTPAQAEPKQEAKVEEKKVEEDKANTVSFITIDDFDKVKLLTGKIIASERVEKADKLLKNTVQIGDEVRTIVSGIAKYYTPEEVVGKTVIVVSNLKPIKLRGIESCGMLLCAVNDKEDKLSLITTDKEFGSGNEVC